ncbi:hypothetical protein [Intestinibacter sp.]|uniref:hypothetical protein n=1 Tax=Intestinibacter sp. TaxID=1965304 RepID=UPI003F162E4B
MKIPSKFNVGGVEITVAERDFLENQALGNSNFCDGTIFIANSSYSVEQSESSKENTFLHELTHLILQAMGQNELHDDEVFVSSFAGFLCEAIKSFKYDSES